MPTLDDVYRKFGEVAEAGQLLETQLGNLLLSAGLVEEGLLNEPDAKRASDLFDRINRQTLGQLLKSLNRSTDSPVHLETVLRRALSARNRLSHSFYRQHNFRRNSDEGRALMMEDLETVHQDLLDAYKSVMLLSGVDLDKLSMDSLPTRHLPI